MKKKILKNSLIKTFETLKQLFIDIGKLYEKFLDITALNFQTSFIVEAGAKLKVLNCCVDGTRHDYWKTLRLFRLFWKSVCGEIL